MQNKNSTHKFSEYQLSFFNAIEHGTGNIVLQASAGSGKTFSALHSIIRMKGSVASMTFAKKNAMELQEKIQSMGLIHAKGSTFHSEGLGNYKRAYGHRVKLDKSKVYFIAEKYTQNPDLAPARKFICDAVKFAKLSGFGIEGCPDINDFKAWMDIVQHHDINLDGEVNYDEAIEIAMQVLKDSNKEIYSIDYDDMIYLPLYRNLDLVKYDWVIIDEAQDSNVIRKIYAERMMKPTSRIVIIGDHAQAIYGFTGADCDSMDTLKERFNAVEMPLPICYRCGKNIVKLAQTIVPEIQYHEDAIEGIVRHEKYDDFLKQVVQYNLTNADGIICRNNAPLVSLAFTLVRQGIGCRIEGRDFGKNLISLCNKWKWVNDLNDFMERLIRFFENEFEKAGKSPGRLQLLEDKLQTMIILIERCQSLGKNDLYSLKNLIESMFSDSDDKNVPKVVTLSSIHRAKGLEWKRCFFLGMDQFIPSKYAILEWQLQQERHLKYVGITRAMEELVFINDVPTRRNNSEE